MNLWTLALMLIAKMALGYLWKYFWKAMQNGFTLPKLWVGRSETHGKERKVEHVKREERKVVRARKVARARKVEHRSNKNNALPSVKQSGLPGNSKKPSWAPYQNIYLTKDPVISLASDPGTSEWLDRPARWNKAYQGCNDRGCGRSKAGLVDRSVGNPVGWKPVSRKHKAFRNSVGSN